MEFSAQEDIHAAQDAVWARLTDFDRLEQMAAAHATLTRQDTDPPSWTTQVTWRGATRTIELCIADSLAPERLRVVGEGSGIRSETTFALVSTGANTTRVTVTVDLTGQSLGGKALVQGLKMARGTLQEKFETRIAGIARALSRDLA